MDHVQPASITDTVKEYYGRVLKTNLGLLGLLLASPVLASAASPWLPPPGSHALSFAYSHTSADELFSAIGLAGLFGLLRRTRLTSLEGTTRTVSGLSRFNQIGF